MRRVRSSIAVAVNAIGTFGSMRTSNRRFASTLVSGFQKMNKDRTLTRTERVGQGPGSLVPRGNLPIHTPLFRAANRIARIDVPRS